jgi:hypothetical protein
MTYMLWLIVLFYDEIIRGQACDCKPSSVAYHDIANHQVSIDADHIFTASVTLFAWAFSLHSRLLCGVPLDSLET